MRLAHCLAGEYGKLAVVGLFVVCGVVSHSVDAQSQPLQILTVDDAIDRALAESSDLQLARLTTSLSADAVRRDVLSILPTIEVSYLDSRSVTEAGPDTYQRTLSVGVDQIIYDNRTYINQRRFSRADLSLATRALTNDENALAIQVLEQVIASVRLRREIAIERVILENLYDQLRIATEERRLGIITELDRLDVAIRVAEFEQSLTLRELERDETRFALNQLLGYPPRTEVAFTEDIDEGFSGFLDNLDPQWYLEQATVNNLDLARSRLALEQQGAEISALRRRWIPLISAGADVSFSGDELPLTDPGYSVDVTLRWDLPLAPSDIDLSAGRQAPRTRNASAGVTTTVNGTGDDLASARAVRIEALRTRTQIDASEEALDFQIERSIRQIEGSRVLLESLRERLNLESQRLEVSELLLDLGRLTRVDYVDAIVSRAELELSLVDSLVELFLQETALLQLAGVAISPSQYRRLIRSIEE